MGWDEIVGGARNRARGALAGGACDLAVGIEDGLVEMTFEDRREVLNVGCAFITDGVRESVGFSSAFAYPPQCGAPALDERAPIGDVFDRVFSSTCLMMTAQKSDGPCDPSASGLPGSVPGTTTE